MVQQAPSHFRFRDREREDLPSVSVAKDTGPGALAGAVYAAFAHSRPGSATPGLSWGRGGGAQTIEPRGAQGP